MQLLSGWGDEGGGTIGLGLVPGTVKRLDPALVPAIPHVGWNSVEVARAHPIFRGVKTGVDFYFVHSYVVDTESPESVLGTTDCGERFASVIGCANAVGIQYHPEKSQANGLLMLDNFCRWDGAC
jgi:glutamine amidotransferase